jgi:hypothetical protein
MSKQLAISAAFSVFATAAFVLSATPDQMTTGAQAYAHAPAIISVLADPID